MSVLRLLICVSGDMHTNRHTNGLTYLQYLRNCLLLEAFADLNTMKNRIIKIYEIITQRIAANISRSITDGYNASIYNGFDKNRNHGYGR